MAELEKKFSLYNSDGTEGLVIKGSENGIEEINSLNLVDKIAREQSKCYFLKCSRCNPSLDTFDLLNDYILKTYKTGDIIFIETNLWDNSDTPFDGSGNFEIVAEVFAGYYVMYTAYSSSVSPYKWHKYVSSSYSVDNNKYTVGDREWTAGGVEYPLDANNVNIADTGNNFTSENVEGALTELSTQFKDVANRLEILPIKNTHHIIQDGVPVSQHTITLNEIECEAYLFNDEQITVPDNLVLENFKNKFSAICFNSKGLVNAIVTYNDGKNDITKEVKLVSNDFNNSEPFSYRENGDTGSLIIEFGFDYDTGKFYVYVGELKADGDSVTFYEVKKVSLSYSYITNLLDDDYLKSIDYSKIKNVPYQLNALLDGSIKTLDTGEYASLFDNLFIWDANKINDRLDDTSGVKQNGYYNHNIKIKQKDSEGIGYGQYIPSSTMSGYKLFVSAGQDVIVKVYNRTRKTLLTKLSDFTYGKYKEITIHDSYSGTDGIFIAFTVKDSVTNFYGNTYVNDLILCKPSTFLTKQDVNNKVDKSQLSFNSDGELVVTIDGISKTFVPKA